MRKAPGFTFTMGFAEKREGMRPPTRHAPLTPLDALRGLLRESSEGDAAFQNRLVQSVQALKRQSLAVLGPALRQPASSRALRRMILQLAVRFDWPEWRPTSAKPCCRKPTSGSSMRAARPWGPWEPGRPGRRWRPFRRPVGMRIDR